MRGTACFDCEYAEPVQLPEGMLRCRRYAPRPNSGGVEPSKIAWPIVAPEDWCGEFLEREPGDEGDEA